MHTHVVFVGKVMEACDSSSLLMYADYMSKEAK